MQRRLIPVNVRAGLLGVQGAGQPLVAQRQKHLDDGQEARGCLGVSEIGFERAEPQRGLALRTIDGRQGGRLNGVTQLSAGPVRLNRLHLGRRYTGILERFANHSSLGGAAGGSEPVRGPILVHGDAHDGAEHRVPSRESSRQRLDEDDTDAFGPSSSGCFGGEGAAATILRTGPLPGELDKSGHGRHDGDTPHQSSTAGTVTQRLTGDGECGQRG